MWGWWRSKHSGTLPTPATLACTHCRAICKTNKPHQYNEKHIYLFNNVLWIHKQRSITINKLNLNWTIGFGVNHMTERINLSAAYYFHSFTEHQHLQTSLSHWKLVHPGRDYQNYKTNIFVRVLRDNLEENWTIVSLFLQHHWLIIFMALPLLRTLSTVCSTPPYFYPNMNFPTGKQGLYTIFIYRSVFFLVHTVFIFLVIW